MTEQMTHSEARQKAAGIVSKMTLNEKISQISYQAPAIERLQIPEYNYWNEALHGVARAGVATLFPQTIGLAATFDDRLVNDIAQVIATEGRAKYNEFVKHNDRDIYKGLTFWSPNVNIFRDPRWGRGQETYGEDPFLTSRFGVAFVKGLQGQSKYLKLAATVKHFAVHSGPEASRHEFNAEVTEKDLFETYLPAFEATVKDADVEGIMTAYNAVNGIPMSVNERFLRDILRHQWQFEGHVVSDYAAPEDVHENHHFTQNAVETMGQAIHAGLDLVAGHIEQSLHGALTQKLITEDEITQAVIDLYATRVRLGMFAKDVDFDKIPFDENDSPEHNHLSYEAATKSLVLLKNNGLLPLNKDKLKSLAVLGPNADSLRVLLGNYFGTPSKHYTILGGLQERVGDDLRIYYGIGSGLFQPHAESWLAKEDERESEAIIATEHADVTIIVLGLDSTIEGEQGDAGNSQGAGDKENLSLPGRQRQLLEKVLAVGKPVIVLLASGSALSLDGLEDHPNLAAILQIWYPGSRGGLAVADVLFGQVSPSGKLPVTFYRNVDNLPPFEDYSMKNRTYRFNENNADVLYPFGFGLTYSEVRLDNLIVEKQKLSVDITNMGDFDIDEVVQVYVKDEQSKYAVPNPQLKAFRRISLKSNSKQSVSFELEDDAFKIVDNDGKRYRDSSEFTIFVGVSQPDDRSMTLLNQKPLSTTMTFEV
ncbi:glycoside hydrolase family 3 C-terminal domain-containing protein [Leuconostoc pseudomesenteroides]|uniref:glycoside hydrolase family 3 C-terminal domain-containing protein n=1 Tax=Leuconostoc pseudomesenteroides TaxID=33968 RepID=UPI00166CDC4C|nr:glycoside hydrolase family 3 C-terminal domain-containing protein [Leuconostoc pseudomesenteroides]